MSVSHGELLIDMFARQDPSDARRDWLPSVVGWRVSASVFQALYNISADFDPTLRSTSPLVNWKIVRDPTMPEGHAVPFDADGNAVTVVAPRTTNARTTEEP